MLPPQNRLRRAADVQRVRQSGQTWRHPLLVLLASSRPEGSPAATRFAFITGRRVGKAVDRNRVKRRLRVIIRSNLNHIAPGHDILLIGRQNSSEATFDELNRSVVYLFKRAGLWVGE